MIDAASIIQSHAHQPLPYQLLQAWLTDYKRPNDKIHALLKEGILEPIKKGLYIAGPALKVSRPDPFLLANHILGPSYVSVDTALSYHGLIPERVYETTSMTTKAARQFKTSMGLFVFIHMAPPYYSFGIQQARLAADQYAMIASPEKALCDKIITTSGVIFRSRKDVMPYLIENLRIDATALKDFNTQAMSGWIADAPKKESLQLLVQEIGAL